MTTQSLDLSQFAAVVGLDWADRKHDVADPGAIGVTEGHCRQPLHIHFHDGKIRFRI